jgi:DNA-binding transcriptional LysR family regulator
MIPELALLRTFLVAARLLSFTGAAAELGMSQPRLSLLIRKLEERIGFPLFIRHHRRVELTDDGAVLYAKTLELDAIADELDALIRERRHDSDWRLRLGGPRWTLDNRARLRLIEEFGAQRPNVEFVSVARQSVALIEDLRAGELDVAILTVPFDARGLEILDFQQSETYVVMPSEDRHAGTDAVPLDAVAGRSLVAYSARIGEPYHRAWFERIEAAGARLVAAHEDHPAAVLRYAARHRLWALYHKWPNMPVPIDAEDRMVARPLAGARDSRIELKFARRAGRGSRALEAFWRLVKSELRKGSLDATAR